MNKKLFFSIVLMAGIVYLNACQSPQPEQQETTEQETLNEVPVNLVADSSPAAPTTIHEETTTKIQEPVMEKSIPSSPSIKIDSPKTSTPSENMNEKKKEEGAAKVTSETQNPSATVEDPPTTTEIPAEENQVKKIAFSHTAWNALLKKYVTQSGKVNYKGFKADKAQLQAYLDQLSANAPSASWSRNEKLAFWINAYNAFTVKLIVDNYPLKSIRDLDKPWDKAFISIGGKSYSLNDIEHKIIRPKFNEPRIHFAVNCASVSCPKLLNEAYTSDKLSGQLTAQSRAYINNAQENDLSSNPIAISSLFDWYKDDFTKSGSVIDFLNTYAKNKVASGTKITFKEYNWGLNE